ncbi:lysine biosynthesis protein LysX [Candidatus Gottesmanbacteria bacterium]|nr:lysine biosynthesis protein LysX [Candidatus Gottesmanbacteria bacterium]
MMVKKTKIGLLHTTIRGDEKLLIEAALSRDISLSLIDVREQIFDPLAHHPQVDIVLERCVSTVKGTHAVEFYESLGIPAVNPLSIATVCENKFLTSLTLIGHRVPTPRFALVFSEEQAKKAVGEIGGYPVVIKPVSGSWGRLVARVNDEHALEAVLEQKAILGGPDHHAYYIQQYIEKPGRDIRIHVIGGRVVAAIYRASSHWVTNTARGAEALPCQIDTDLETIAKKAGDAIGEGVLGIDVFETNDGYVVNEVNHTMEFKNVQRVTGIDIAGIILDYCLSVARRKR